MLALNRAKLAGRANVRWEVRDAFSLEASHAHDLAFMGFFLSHVPRGRFSAFWAVLEGLLGPGGQVLFVDERRHHLWTEDWLDEARGIVRRRLTDGTAHRAVKVLWHPDELERSLHDLGWDASIRVEGPFLWGIASRRAHRPHGPDDR